MMPIALSIVVAAGLWAAMTEAKDPLGVVTSVVGALMAAISFIKLLFISG